MAVNYKILCEVRLLHEYYLTDHSGTTIFDRASETERLQYLLEKFRDGQPSVNRDLACELPYASTAMAGLKLRIMDAYCGFKLYTAVSPETLPGGVRAYRPAQPIPPDLPILIQLRKKGSTLDTISNTSIQQSLPAR